MFKPQPANAGGSGSPAASIVQIQTATLAALNTGLVMASAPLNKSLLVAFVFSTGGQNTLGAGWSSIQNITDGSYDPAIFYKITGAAETTAQSPCGNVDRGLACIFELANAMAGFSGFNNFAGVNNPSLALVVPKSTGLIIGCLAITTAAITSTFTNATVRQTVSGNAQSGIALSNSAPAQGSTLVTAAMSGAGNGTLSLCAVG